MGQQCKLDFCRSCLRLFMWLQVTWQFDWGKLVQGVLTGLGVIVSYPRRHSLHIVSYPQGGCQGFVMGCWCMTTESGSCKAPGGPGLEIRWLQPLAGSNQRVCGLGVNFVRIPRHVSSLMFLTACSLRGKFEQHSYMATTQVWFNTVI